MKYIHAMRRSYLVGFIILLALLWADEIFDMPYRFLGAPATPFNYYEAFLESAIVLCVMISFVYISFRLERHIKYIEGLTVICANCKKVKDQNEWVPIESWLRKKTDVLFSHGVCRECFRKLYPKEYISLVKKGKIAGE